MALLQLLSFFAVSVHSFNLNLQMVALERLDPIVSPGKISSHVHVVAGGSEFGSTVNPELAAECKCAGALIQQDCSNYWMPPVYTVDDNGMYQAAPLKDTRVYYLNQDGNHSAQAPPPGFRMLLGNPNARTPQTGVPFDWSGGMGWECDQGNGDPSGGFFLGFPPFPCKKAIMARASFPFCWNGSLDSADHISHVTWPQGDGCPASHPITLPRMLLEFTYWTLGIDSSRLRLANGDVTGYSIHADYVAGWNVTILNEALRDPTCRGIQNMYGSEEQCQALLPYANSKAMAECKLSQNIVHEDVGVLHPISQLPGCNPDSGAGIPSSTCQAPVPTPTLGPADTFINWQQPSNVQQDSTFYLAVATKDLLSPSAVIIPAPSSSKTSTSTSTSTSTKATSTSTTTTTPKTTSTSTKTTSTAASAPSPSPNTHVFLTPETNWGGSSGDKQNWIIFTTPGKCNSFANTIFANKLGSAGPDPGVVCRLYSDGACTASKAIGPAEGFRNPGIANVPSYLNKQKPGSIHCSWE